MTDEELRKKIKDTLWTVLPKYLPTHIISIIVTYEFFEAFDEDD